MLTDSPPNKMFTEEELQERYGDSWSTEILKNDSLVFRTADDGKRYYYKKGSLPKEMSSDIMGNNVNEDEGETRPRQQEPTLPHTAQLEQEAVQMVDEEKAVLPEQQENPSRKLGQEARQEVEVEEVGEKTIRLRAIGTVSSLSAGPELSTTTSIEIPIPPSATKASDIDKQPIGSSPRRADLMPTDEAKNELSEMSITPEQQILPVGAHPEDLSRNSTPEPPEDPEEKPHPITVDSEDMKVPAVQEPIASKDEAAVGVKNEDKVVDIADQPRAEKEEETIDTSKPAEVLSMRQHIQDQPQQKPPSPSEVIEDPQPSASDDVKQPVEQVLTEYLDVEKVSPRLPEEVTGDIDAKEVIVSAVGDATCDVETKEVVVEPVDVENAKFKKGDRVVGMLGDFGTVAIMFKNLEYGVDFDDGSKYRVPQDQLHPLPERLKFDLGSTILYERPNDTNIGGTVEKYFGDEVYGLKLEDGRKKRVLAEFLRLTVLEELEISKDTDVSTWNWRAVRAWLNKIRMLRYCKEFNKLSGRKLLGLTDHNLAEIGVRRKDRPHFLKQLDDLRETCKASSLPGSQGIILEFAKRPLDFDVEWYDYTLTASEITSKLEKRGLCRGMKLVSCNGVFLRNQTFEQMLENLRNASFPVTIKFEKILVKQDSKKSVKGGIGEVAPYIGEGPTYIIKQGLLFFAVRDDKGKEPNWQKRWCVLQSDDTLHFYTKPSEVKEKSRGFIKLNLKNIATKGEQLSEKDYFMFIVPCKERTYKFKCRNLPYLNSWICAVNEMCLAQKKRARQAPLPQGPSRIIESMIKKNELSALWKHPETGKTALQICLDLNKMGIIQRYINNDQNLLRLREDDGGLNLRKLILKALEIVNSIPTGTVDDLRHREETLTLLGTVYDRIPATSWAKVLIAPGAVLENLFQLLHKGTRPNKDDPGRPPMDRKIWLSCEAVIATLCQPVLEPTDDLHNALLCCFQNRKISHLFEILLKSKCNLAAPGRKSLLYRVIDLPTWDVTPARYNQMFELMVKNGAPVTQLSYGDQADMERVGIDALTKAISLLHIESMQIMLYSGTEITPVHTKALFTLVTRSDVMIIDKVKFLESLETLLTYGAELGPEDWMNMGSFVKADGEDLKKLGQRAQTASTARVRKIRRLLPVCLQREERVRRIMAEYIPHQKFNAPLFFEGLRQFLQLRQQCLQERFPKNTAVKEVEQKEEKCVVQ